VGTVPTVGSKGTQVCRLAALLAACGLAALPLPSATSAGVSPLGHVRVIMHGLTLLRPRAVPAPARVGERLFGADGLQTRQAQRASVAFFDGSILDLDQRTEVVFRSVKLIELTTGRIAEVDASGRRQRVQTNAAVATALGTRFAVFITPKGGSSYPTGSSGSVVLTPGSTTVSVVAGVVRVANPYGSVRVRAGEWTHVTPGHAPTKPKKHNAAADVAWTVGL